MGLFNDLGFKKNSNNEIVSPNSAKFNGKHLLNVKQN